MYDPAVIPETTEGITADDVAQAMTYLGMYNPKPQIPLETTVSGHEIVALARAVQLLQSQIRALEDAYATLLTHVTK